MASWPDARHPRLLYPYVTIIQRQMNRSGDSLKPGAGCKANSLPDAGKEIDALERRAKLRVSEALSTAPIFSFEQVWSERLFTIFSRTQVFLNQSRLWSLSLPQEVKSRYHECGRGPLGAAAAQKRAYGEGTWRIRQNPVDNKHQPG
jgi:hypothetical protein